MAELVAWNSDNGDFHIYLFSFQSSQKSCSLITLYPIDNVENNSADRIHLISSSEYEYSCSTYKRICLA